MNLQLLTVLASVLVCGPLFVNGACPDASQVLQMLTSCLSQYSSLTDVTTGHLSVTQLNGYCSSSARKTEIQCAENIFNECRQTSADARRILDKAVNINAIRGSMKIVCNNAQIFAEKQDCIGRYQGSVSSCIFTELTNYNTKLQSLQVDAVSEGAEWLEEKIYEELCNYFSEVADCQRPYGQNCGPEIRDVYDALLYAAIPPVCVGVMEHVNLVLLISLAVVALVKGKM